MDLTKTEALIAQMIAKAESTNFPAEAEAFMARAEKLMLRHGIERANLEAKATRAAKPEIVTVRFQVANGHGYAAAMTSIAHRLGATFSVRTFETSLAAGAKMVWLVGHQSDVEALHTLVTTLMAQSRKQAIHWWRAEGKAAQWWATDNDAYLARREFIYAFGRGAQARLEETRNQVVQEAEAGTELVLVERSAAVDAWVDENMTYGEARPSRRRDGGYAARAAGKAAGRDAVDLKAVR